MKTVFLILFIRQRTASFSAMFLVKFYVFLHIKQKKKSLSLIGLHNSFENDRKKVLH